MKKMTNIYKPLILTVLCGFACLPGLGQVNGNKYVDKRVGSSIEIKYVNASNEGVRDDHLPSEAIDGNSSTYWQVNFRDDVTEAWLMVDLGEVYENINKINLTFNNAERCPTKLAVYSSISESTDKTDWGNPLFTVDDVPSQRNISQDVTLTGRYVIIWITGTTDPEGQGRAYLHELSFDDGTSFLTSEISIKHKSAKWYDVFNLKCNGVSDAAANSDTFDEKEENEPAMLNSPATTAEGEHIKIQNTHVLVETIYVKKGKSITLTVPDWLNETANNRTYQRWYNYETDGTFATGADLTSTDEEVDLLTPGTSIPDGPANGDGYRFANGYIGSPLSANPLYTMNFHYPENGEDRYIVACDLSGYNDFTENYAEDSKNKSFITEGVTEAWEPTLSHRILYYIEAVGETSPDVDVKNITFAATRIPNKTDEMVALSRDARAYTIPENTGD